MSKRILTVFVLLLIVCMGACVFVACDNNDGTGSDIGSGTEPGEEASVDVVLKAYAARISNDMATGAAASDAHWFAAAYGMNTSDPEWLNDNLGGGYDPAHGVVAWGVVGSHGDEDIGDGQHAEYIWTDDSVFWVKYESAETALEKGLSSFGVGVTFMTTFPSAEAFEGFAYKTVGSYVVAARVEKTLDDFFAADTAQSDEVIADAVQWIDMTSEQCIVFVIASAGEEYFEISSAMEYNPDHLTGGKQMDCRFYADAAELAAAVEAYRQEYEGDDTIDVYARGNWLVIDDKGEIGPGVETGEYYIDAAVLNAHVAAVENAVQDAAVGMDKEWEALAYAVDVSDPEFLKDMHYDTYGESYGIIAWGAVGTNHLRSDIIYPDNTDTYGETVWEDGSVLWVAYETEEMAAERGMSQFGKGCTYVTFFPSNDTFKDYKYKVVGNCVVAARNEADIEAFLAGGSKVSDGSFANVIGRLQLEKEAHCAVYFTFSKHDGEISAECASEPNMNYTNRYFGVMVETCASEEEAAEMAKRYNEEFAGLDQYGEESIAWADGCFCFASITPPAPGLYLYIADWTDEPYAYVGNYIYDSPDPVTVNIPAEYEGLPVKSISGFNMAKPVKEVIIPEGVEQINYDAFAGSGLQRITIPASVTEIGMLAFDGCADLEEIVVADGNPVYHSDGNCVIVTSEKLLYAGSNASVIPSDGSVTAIRSEAFSGFTELTSIEIPASVTSIGSAAFSGCDALTEIVIDEGNPVYRAEGGCIIEKAGDVLVSVTGGDTIPASVKVIGDGAFAYDYDLTSLTIPATVERIEAGAFTQCTYLEDIHIEKGSKLGVDSIDANAFVDTWWYKAQPDGPLYIDGILVGYKNYDPSADPVSVQGRDFRVENYGMVCALSFYTESRWKVTVDGSVWAQGLYELENGVLTMRLLSAESYDADPYESDTAEEIYDPANIFLLDVDGECVLHDLPVTFYPDGNGAYTVKMQLTALHTELVIIFAISPDAE